MATSEPIPWAHYPYPVQSSPTQSPLSDSTPQLDQLLRTDTPSTPNLPRYIRAVKDSRASKAKGRTLIVCLDGTGDKFDGDNSNIVHIVSCLKKDDPTQVTYYQSGIGTYSEGGLSNGLAAMLDMAVGSGLGLHVRDAYHFLMQTYREGDKICLFGFSRGAYTARCLAGMIHKVGLLPAHNCDQIPFAYQYYKDDTQRGWMMSSEFKKTFCMNVSVYFVGVFDSVASVGFIPRQLPLSSTPTNKALYFRHAMGLDEHRAKFKACRYEDRDHISPELIAEIDGKPSESTRTWNEDTGAPQSSRETLLKHRISLKTSHICEGGHARDADVLEVWFAGCHADIGGGAVLNEERHKLSQIPLRWMLRQCFECNTGILFDTRRLAEVGLDVHTLWPVYNKPQKPVVGPPPSLMDRYEQGQIAPISRRSSVLKPVNERNMDGEYSVELWQDNERQIPVDHWVPEQIEDYFDAMSPINDQLVQAKGWWILEAWPIQVRVQPEESDSWEKKIALNLGRYRPVQETDPKLHWTVQLRMQDKGYKIKARVDRNAIWQVVV